MQVRQEINEIKTRKGRERKRREEKGRSTTKIQRITRDYLNKLYVTILDSLEEMGKFLETYDLPSLNHEEKKKYLNRPIVSREIESVNKILPIKKSQDQMIPLFHKILKVTPILLNSSKKIEGQEIVSN